MNKAMKSKTKQLEEKNAMRLFIAEKPSLGRAIAAGLGNAEKRNGYIECGQNVVTWCFGHLLEMDQPEAYDERYKAWKKKTCPFCQTPLMPRSEKTLQHK